MLGKALLVRWQNRKPQELDNSYAARKSLYNVTVLEVWSLLKSSKAPWEARLVYCISFQQLAQEQLSISPSAAMVDSFVSGNLQSLRTRQGWTLFSKYRKFRLRSLVATSVQQGTKRTQFLLQSFSWMQDHPLC